MNELVSPLSFPNIYISNPASFSPPVAVIFLVLQTYPRPSESVPLSSFVLTTRPPFQATFLAEAVTIPSRGYLSNAIVIDSTGLKPTSYCAKWRASHLVVWYSIESLVPIYHFGLQFAAPMTLHQRTSFGLGRHVMLLSY
jgi:hypothetical protein